MDAWIDKEGYVLKLTYLRNNRSIVIGKCQRKNRETSQTVWLCDEEGRGTHNEKSVWVLKKQEREEVGAIPKVEGWV